jgi:HlyD family secretion protein
VPIQSVTVRTPDQLKDKAGKPGKFVAGKDGFVEVVWVVEDGKAYAKPVTTGIQSDDAIEIKTGLKEGETVVSGTYRAISRDLNIGDAVVLKKKDDKSAGGSAEGGK